MFPFLAYEGLIFGFRNIYLLYKGLVEAHISRMQALTTPSFRRF